MLIPNVKKSDKPVLINVIYHRKKKNVKDYISLIYKIGSKKFVHNIDEPSITFYFSNNKLYTAEDACMISECTKHTCKYNNLLKKIAELSGNEDFFYNTIKSGARGAFKALGALHLVHEVFGTDIDITDYYIYKFLNEYGQNEDKILSKGHFDIETDGRTGDTLDTENANANINVITYLSSLSNSFYTFVLKNDEYEGQSNVLNNINTFSKRCNDEFSSDFGVKDYKFLAYDDEREMLTDFISLIKHESVDFLSAYNGLNYDYPYIINRMKRLRMDKFMLCDSDFKEENLVCDLYTDRMHFDPEKNNSTLTVSSKISFMDSMKNYVTNRSNGDSMSSYKLDDICDSELGIRKVSHEYSFRDFAYKDYENFLFYSVKDSLLLEKLEDVVEDIDTIHSKAMDNITRPTKVFSQTVFLSNRAYLQYIQDGMIKGNNQNTRYGGAEDMFKTFHAEDEYGKIPGGFVASPLLNDNYGMMMGDKQSDRIFLNCVDMDYSAHYPNAVRSHNISNMTMIGMCKIVDFSPYNEQMYYDDKFPYLKGGNMLDDLITRQFFKFGTKWLNLPTIRELMIKYKKLLNDRVTEKYISREIKPNNNDKSPIVISRVKSFTKSITRAMGGKI